LAAVGFFFLSGDEECDAPCFQNLDGLAILLGHFSPLGGDPLFAIRRSLLRHTNLCRWTMNSLSNGPPEKMIVERDGK
jgi:hypothetical protein